jgi:MYXO-CTERM domain-containing protein
VRHGVALQGGCSIPAASRPGLPGLLLVVLVGLVSRRWLRRR